MLVYVPLDTTVPVYYAVSTNRMRNALPPTLTRVGPRATYTVDGACLQSTPPMGPSASLGASCAMVPTHGWYAYVYFAQKLDTLLYCG